MENDGDAWHTASARGKGPKSARQQRQPIKNGDVRQNGVLHDTKGSTSVSKDFSRGSNNVQINNEQRNNSNFIPSNRNQQSYYRPPPPSAASTVMKNGYAADPKKSLEKEIKSLTKQEASFERARWLFNEELIKSQDRLKRAFSELRELLNQREQCLLTELEQCKVEGLIMVDNREELGRQLRLQTERAAKMSDRELAEVRQNIRKFVNERKLEDDIGKTLRFQYEPDKIIDLINNFGEVIPVNQAPQKSTSINSLISADSADASAASSDAGKALNRVMIGGLLIQSDSMDTTQLADLTRQLQESLKMQGITDDIIPDVTGSSGSSMPQRRRPASATVTPSSSSTRGGKRGGGGGGDNRGGRR